MLALVLAVMVMLIPRSAAAESPCSAQVEAWVEACAAASERSMVADACPSGMLIVRVDLGDAGELRVELRRPAEPALETIGELGLSPIGEFPQWSEAPVAIREAFADVVDCARERAPPAFVTGPPGPRHIQEYVVVPRPALVLPWLGLLGLLGVVLVFAQARVPLRRRELGLALGLALVSVVIATQIEWSYFLQNGHGPEWMRYALTGEEALGGYGPGYAELLGGIVRPWPHAAELALGRFYLGLLGILALSVYVAARSVGARPALAAALVLALAVEPTCLRLVRSAAYHTPILALHALALAVLVVGVRRAGRLDSKLGIAVLTAGLLVAQAARIHPVGWLSAAMLPATIVFVPGHARTRVIQAVVAGLAIALVVALTSWASLRGATETGPGQGALARMSWLHVGVVTVGLVGLVCLGLASATVALRRRLIVVVLVVVLGLAVSLDPLRSELWRYRAGYYITFAPLVGLGLVALLARFKPRARPQGIAAAILVLAAAASGLRDGASRLRVATDARESTLAIDWRDDDWGATELIYLGDVHGRAHRLPLQGSRLVARELAVDEVSTVHVAAEFLYYRSSACSYPDGRAACEALEARFELDTPALFEHELPAQASQPWAPFDVDVVRVGLYRARPRAQPR